MGKIMARRERMIAMNKERMKNYDGMRINNFTVIRRDKKDERGSYWFLCECDCGSEFLVRGGDMKYRKSCGCMTKQIISEKMKKHGGNGTKLYYEWHHMKDRCYNSKHKSYANYGGRGIVVCPEWLNDFGAFRDWANANGFDESAEYMKCTLDRIDSNGNYEPSNCRWVDMKKQSNNRRNNRKITYGGETHTLSEWAEIVGLRPCTLSKRLSYGWSIEESLTRRKKLWRGK